MALIPSLQEKNPEQEPIPIVLRDTVAYLQAHGECQAWLSRSCCGHLVALGTLWGQA